jgi:hypothetical protein
LTPIGYPYHGPTPPTAACLAKEEYLQTINGEVGYVYASFISYQLYFHHSLAARFIDQVEENDVISFQITPLKGEHTR